MEEQNLALGERVMNVAQQFIIQNSFYIVVLITFSLFCVSFYNRFIRINKNTDEINLVDRYLWLEYYRSKTKKKD